GKVYAISTVGSIVGILGTSFYLVPQLGTRMTLQILCALSGIVGALGLIARKRIAFILLLLSPAALLIPKPHFDPNILFITESVYNWVAVLAQGDLRWLVLNRPAHFQTIQKEGSTWSGYYQDDFALGALLVPAKNMLVLGLGAGGSLKSTLAIAPNIQ